MGDQQYRYVYAKGPVGFLRSIRFRSPTRSRWFFYAPMAVEPGVRGWYQKRRTAFRLAVGRYRLMFYRQPVEIWEEERP